MRRILFILSLALTLDLCAQTNDTIPFVEGKYHYETVKGDPTHVRMCTLPNGLRVYLMINNDQPRIQTAIAVRTGGKNDPAETTGLAHYLEHIMFKGTTQFGTTDYEAEKPLLDEIERLYETYRKTTDPEQRKETYHVIDSISYEASKIAVANEYDKLMSAIGATGSNAFTSVDETCYVEDIPANEVDNWAAVQSERFKNMVVRGFHTELEAVYEEYNRGLTQDIRKVLEAANALLYPNHPYGKQTVIGTQEHLKNPSITNIKNYFHKYYVPNNVAICMCGNLSPDDVMDIITKYFGDWRRGDDIQPVSYVKEEPLKGELRKDVYGQESEYVTLGWRFPGMKEQDCEYAQIIGNLLHNGKAGFFDTNINLQQKALATATYTDEMSDYTSLLALGYPKEGQSLDEVKTLMLKEVAKLLRGEFNDQMLQSIINNMKRSKMRMLESNRESALKMAETFIYEKGWNDEVSRLERISKIKRRDVIDFARKYLSDHNYVCVYKHQGTDPDEKKIDKPAISPIEMNRDKQTAFVDSILRKPTEPILPEYVDFENDVKTYRLKHGNSLLYRKNDKNGLFNLTYIIETGSKADKYLPYAANYFQYLGTKKLSSDKLQLQLYGLACDINISVNQDQTYIRLSGLAENQLQAMRLLEDWIKNVKVDQSVYDSYIQDVLKLREDNKSDQSSCYERLYAYCVYGPENDYTNIPSAAELKSTKPELMLDKIKHLSDYKQIILYYGPSTMREITDAIEDIHKTSKNPIPPRSDNHYLKQQVTENEVFVANYDSKAINMSMYSNNGQVYDLSLVPKISLFNEYFGGGMNTIVFQELRESRGLAYQASARYEAATRKGETNAFRTYIISQNDKMGECIDVFNDIIEHMPLSENSFSLSKKNLKKTIESERYVGASLLYYVFNMKKLGINHDINEDIYRDASKLTLKGLEKFANENVTGRKYRYIILGNIEDLDMEKLNSIGKVNILSLEQIFGY